MNRFILVLLLLISVIDLASAATVTYVRDRRYAYEEGSLIGTRNFNPSAPYADFFVDKAPLLFHNSSLGANGFTASLISDLYSSSPYANPPIYYFSKSVFDITFYLNQDTNMSLNAYMTAGLTNNYQFATLALYRGDFTVDSNLLFSKRGSYYGDPCCDLTPIYNSTLGRGIYRLVAIAEPSEMGSYLSLTSNFSVVPVPAAVWLFGGGLLGMFGLFGRRRCRT